MFIISCAKIISVLLGIVGALFIIPISVALYYGESDVLLSFIIPAAISIIAMFAINIPTRKIKISLKTKQTFLIVALSWIFASLMCACVFYSSGYFSSFVDALFESVSGITTTGATILSDVERLPRSINLLRCLTHWIGGMGIVTLTVALLPLLGIGGFQLIKAETTGPEKGKVTARITTTAKILWLIYFGLTVIETVALMIAGMDFVDALSHAFATVGTGGFSTKNASIGSFNSAAIDIICTIFMFLCGINFSLFYYLIIKKFSDVYENSELKAYFSIVVVFILIITFSLMPTYKSFGTSLRYSAFQVVSIITTTGFATADYLFWPFISQVFLFLLFFVGGCSGSTGGGIKVIRWVILGKQLNNETKQMLHPHGVFTIQLNKRVCRKEIVFNVASFMTLYLVLVAITTVIGCIGNLDVLTSFSAAASMVGNIGPAFGSLGPSNNCAMIPDFVKLWYSFAMLAGRLELYTMMIFFMPSYWEK